MSMSLKLQGLGALCGSPVACLGLAVLEGLIRLADHAVPPALTAHKLHLHVQAPSPGHAHTWPRRRGAGVHVGGSQWPDWNGCRLQPITSQRGSTDQGRTHNDNEVSFSDLQISTAQETR